MRRITTLLLVAAAASVACGKSSTPPPSPQQAAAPNAAPPAQPVAASAAVEQAATSAADKKAAASLIGTTPPDWNAERWLGSPPLTLASLRGSVVLVRWWTAGCPFCSASAPALRTFHKTYGPRGLKVIGLYHHKESTPFDPAVYEATARKYGFTFPVAYDPEWKTLEAWMHDSAGNAVDTGFTSVTFLLDKKGVVRHVHPGGQYVEGDPGYVELQAAIERLLAEP